MVPMRDFLRVRHLTLHLGFHLDCQRVIPRADPRGCWKIECLAVVMGMHLLWLRDSYLVILTETQKVQLMVYWMAMSLLESKGWRRKKH